jgi:MYND finger
MRTNSCCAECGKEDGGGVVSLKTCKSCMLVKYCNATCQRNHWATHKKEYDKALFKDPPSKEDCPICFLPMLKKFISCFSLPPATISSVPIYDFAIAHQELANISMYKYYPCCGKSICKGCAHSFSLSGNENCPFCNSNRGSKTDEENVEDLMKRVAANDPGAIFVLAQLYSRGLGGLQQDQTKAMELYARSADLGNSDAHSKLGMHHQGGDLKKAKFHYEVAAGRT